MEKKQTQQALTEKLGLQKLIGKSPVFTAEINKIPILAKVDVSVLISGETGTGKEMVARAIHYLSERADKPFVPVNCGAIPVDLLENELFGHDRGAFTGASDCRRGVIQEAEKGTLFLDEVDSLPLLAQVKLLRFLQDKEYRPLGSTKAMKGDVRIIAASNAHLENAIAAGTLRRDLYYRLNVVPMLLPALRHRANDIILLARHFLAEKAARLNSPAVDFSPEAERKLMLYSWPGNVRELEHVIERVMVLCTEKTMQEDHIIFSGEINQPDQLSFQEMKANVISEFETNYIQSLLVAYKGNITRAAQAAQKERRTEANASPLTRASRTLPEAVAELEREMIENALSYHQNNISRAAATLGLSRFGLQRKLKRLSGYCREQAMATQVAPRVAAATSIGSDGAGPVGP
jgi:two-component system, NtrC family, response regulator GlrR